MLLDIWIQFMYEQANMYSCWQDYYQIKNKLESVMH